MSKATPAAPPWKSATRRAEVLPPHLARTTPEGNEDLHGKGIPAPHVLLVFTGELVRRGMPIGQALTYTDLLWRCNERLDHGPGLGRIAADTGRQDRAIKRDVALLTEQGFLRHRDGQTKALRQGAKGYDFPPWPDLAARLSEVYGKPVDTDATSPPGDTTPRGGVTPRHGGVVTRRHPINEGQSQKERPSEDVARPSVPNDREETAGITGGLPAVERLATVYAEARRLDATLEEVRSFAAWGRAALAEGHAAELTAEDILAGWKAYRVKGGKWASGWAVNAWNARQRAAEDIRQEAAAAEKQALAEQPVCRIAEDLAIGIDAEAEQKARDAAWQALPIAERRRWIQRPEAMGLDQRGKLAWWQAAGREKWASKRPKSALKVAGQAA